MMCGKLKNWFRIVELKVFIEMFLKLDKFQNICSLSKIIVV